MRGDEGCGHFLLHPVSFFPFRKNPRQTGRHFSNALAIRRSCKDKRQMQCGGGGIQPIRPQGISPASPAPPPPSFPSPNRPRPKRKCGGLMRKIRVLRRRGRWGTRLPRWWRAHISRGGWRGKGRGVGRVREGRGGNCWGLIWFPLAPPALHLNFAFKRAAFGQRIRLVSGRQAARRGICAAVVSASKNTRQPSLNIFFLL